MSNEDDRYDEENSTLDDLIQRKFNYPVRDEQGNITHYLSYKQVAEGIAQKNRK